MKAALSALFAVLMIFLFPITAHGEGELKDIYDELPKELEELFPDGFDEEIEKDGGTDAVKKLDGAFVLSFIGKAMSGALSDVAPTVANLTAVVLLSALLMSLSKNGGTTVGKAMSFASGIALGGACISVIKPIAEQCTDTVNAVSGIIKSSLPIMTMICQASGQVSSSAVNSAFLSAFLALTEEVSRSVLSPLLALCIAFTLVSSLSRASDIDLSHMVGSVKKVFVFFISLVSTVLCVTMAFQSVIAKGSDTVLLRSIKFASGNTVPIVGAALSEAAGTYLSSLSLIKSSAGALVAAAVALAVLPMILKLFALKLCLTFVAFVSDILGVNGGTVRDFASMIDMMTAMLVISSMIFVITMGLFASAMPSI